MWRRNMFWQYLRDPSRCSWVSHDWIVRITFLRWKLNSDQSIMCSIAFSLITSNIVKDFGNKKPTHKKGRDSLKPRPRVGLGKLFALPYVPLLIILSTFMTRVFRFRMYTWSSSFGLLSEERHVRTFCFSLLCHRGNSGYLNPGSCPVILLYTLGRLTKNPTWSRAGSSRRVYVEFSSPYMAKLGLPIVNP